MASIIFIVLLLLVGKLAFGSYKKIYDNIRLGKEEHISGQEGERWKNVLLVAFGQKKMFKNWTPAVLHFFIYAAFLLTQIELIEIIIDGIFGTHRVFSFLGGFYTFIIGFIEILSLLALVATFSFLYRRNILRVPRLVKSELNGWPKLDANFILLGEILLVIGIFSMNGADHVLQQRMPEKYHHVGFMPISSMLSGLFSLLPTLVLVAIERFGWWLHVLVVFGFILYLPISKHLHVFLAFPNIYFNRLKPRGEMSNMPEIMNEVKSMMGLSEGNQEYSEEIPKFGACDVTDLSWKNILDAYSCTECGRCTAECPANMTGKKLSPRKIMMDVRDRATEVGDKIRSGKSEYIKADASDKSVLTKQNFDDGSSLFNLITKEEIRACTTCNACVEACPVMIDPLDIILQLRRYEVLTESSTAESWTPMFTSMENQGSVWQVPQERSAWVNE
jgi:heterodisulfide reductase subunit C